MFINTRTMKRIGIIGAGIFGLSIGIELAKRGYDITIFDRAKDILCGASTINHLRHHYGFHYPRSKDTVLEIQKARQNFEKEFGECIGEFFPDYYWCCKEGTKTTPENFIKFCDEMNLPYKIEWPEERYMDRNKIGVCIKVPERVYDPNELKKLIYKKLKGISINLKLGYEVIGGEILGKKKKIRAKSKSGVIEEEFDFIINATYSNFNSFNKWFGFPRKKLQYEKIELLELEIPNQMKVGLTIMDGEFSSILPRGNKGTFTLGHVKESVLKAIVSDDLDVNVMTEDNTKSNRDVIIKEGIKDFPFLKNAKIIRSLFVTRVVRPNVEDTDERPSEITNYGNGMYSVFGGKVITCVDIARKVVEMIKEEELK